MKKIWHVGSILSHSEFWVVNSIISITSLHLMFLFPLLQSIEHQTAMEFLQKADRRSLLAENQALHAKINGREVTGNKEQETDTSSQGVSMSGWCDFIANGKYMLLALLPCGTFSSFSSHKGESSYYYC